MQIPTQMPSHSCFESCDMPSLIFPVTLWPGTTCAPAEIQFHLIWSSSSLGAASHSSLWFGFVGGKHDETEPVPYLSEHNSFLSLNQPNTTREEGRPLTSHVTSSFPLRYDEPLKRLKLLFEYRRLTNTYVFWINHSKWSGDHENMTWVVTKMFLWILILWIDIMALHIA